MGLTINTNPAAIQSAFNLAKNNQQLQQSLTRLSSGKRILKPSDDAGGLAVSMKLNASLSRMSASIANIQNAVSFGEVQDGALTSAATILDRMAELKSFSQDVIKSSTDKANYNTEFKALQQQLYQIAGEAFNGVSLFATTKSSTDHSAAKFGTDNHTISVFTSDRGAAGSVVSLNKSLVLGAVTFVSVSDDSAETIGSGITLAAASSGAAIDIDTLGISFFNSGLERVATLRAENGATMARFGFAEDHLRLSKANLESANSRIMDVDVAEESTRLAKFNILTQASAAMLAQANLSPNSALMLLG